MATIVTGWEPLVTMLGVLVVGLFVQAYLDFKEGKYGYGVVCIALVLGMAGTLAITYLSFPGRPGWENWFPVLEGLSWIGVVIGGVSLGVIFALLAALSRK